ncbi:universal stress protein [Stygiolobus caldivivus]|uniref:Universal stress protein A n=1 Tax=Stygiolobus caldivivus TaxID=2824673 RepID=A0A8D5U4L2_9CREN|nr:universal stress protein [Stygiolobus caldivivus]BCU69370.1 universal stress protein A [Stygiolobus caldivivus]
MRYVVAYDGSEHSRKAVMFLLKILKKEDEVHLVTVVKEPPKSPEQKIIEERSKAEEMQKEIQKDLSDFSVKLNILESLDVPEAVIEYCEKVNCDVIVTGSRGLTGLKKIVMGSVSEAILNKSHVPVLIIR